MLYIIDLDDNEAVVSLSRVSPLCFIVLGTLLFVRYVVLTYLILSAVLGGLMPGSRFGLAPN